MGNVLTVLLLVGLFVASHMLLGARAVRRALVAKLGHIGFSLLFSVTAYVLFGLLLFAYAGHRTEGPAGLGLGEVAVVRWLAIALSAIGVVLGLSIAAPRGYADSPMALFTRDVREPYGLERITRHPFFAGVTLFCGAHILLAQRLISVVFFAGFGLLAAVGAWLQDRRLRVRKGAAYEDFLRKTSAVPFAAIIAGRQRLAWAELPYTTLAICALAAWGLYKLHNSGFAYHAELGVAALFVGPSVMTALSWWRNRRQPAEKSAASSQNGRPS